MKEVVDYLNRKFLERQNRLGERLTLKMEAAYIGVTPTTYSSWSNGYSVPTGENLRKVAKAYGPEIYSVVGATPPDEQDPIETFPEPLKSISRELRSTLSEKSIPADSPEAAVIMDEILKKFGYVLSSKED